MIRDAVSSGYQLGSDSSGTFFSRRRPKSSGFFVSTDDHQLIERCLQGETDAFGLLMVKYQDRLYNTTYRMLGNADDAQDVVQEAFIHAYQSLASFKGDSQFFTWLYRIAINAAISSKRKRRLVLSIDAARNGESFPEPEDLSREAKPSHAIESHEQSQHVQEALSKLSIEHRMVLILKDMEGEKYETMAELLQVPIGTIRSRLHRARLELRELLESEDDHD